MKRTLKWLLGVLTALVLLLLVAAVALPLLFDAEDLRRTIELRGSKATGRDLRIEGDLDFTVFPWLAIEVSQISLGNAPGFGNEPIASAEKARISVGLVPLLHRELIADEIRLAGLQLDLQVNAQGLNNWDDLAGEDSPGPAAEPSAITHFQAAGIDLRNAHINYRDDRSGSHWVLRDLALKTGELVGGESIDLSLQGHLEDRVARNVIVLDTRTRLTHDFASGNVLLEQMALAAELDEGVTRFELQSPRIEVDLEAQTFDAEGLIVIASLDDGATRANIQSVKANGGLEPEHITLNPVTIDAHIEGGKTGGRLEGARLEANLEARQFAITQLKAVLNLDGQPKPIPLEATRLDADLEAQTLALERFTTRYANADIEGTLTARDIQADDPTARGHLRIASFVPRDLMAALGFEAPETADAGVLSSGSLKTDFDGGRKQMSLSNMRLDLDDSRIEGRLGLPDVEKGAVRFDLDIDAIDLDRYLSPEETTTPAAAGTAAPLPREALRGWDVEGTLRVGRLRLLDMDLQGATLGVTARDDVVRLNPAQAQLFGGRYAGDITLDASGEVLDVKADHHLDSVSVQAIGERFGGVSQLSGTVAAEAATNGRGNSSEALLNSMSGSVDLDLSNGALEGVNVWHEIYEAYARYRGRSGPPPAPERTEISRLLFSGPIRDGTIETRELSGDVQGVLRLTGRGTIRLSDQQLDLGLTAQVRNVPKVTEDPAVVSLAGQRLPLRITGAMASPSVSVDFAELLKAQAADQLLEKLSGSRERDPNEPVSSKDQLRDAATDLLRGLLNKEQPPPQEEDDRDDGG